MLTRASVVRAALTSVTGLGLAVALPCRAQSGKTVWDAETPLTFHYAEPLDWSGIFSCVGLITQGFGAEQCLAGSAFGLRLYTGAEVAVFPPVRIHRTTIHLVPDVQVEHQQVNSDYQFFTDANGQRYEPPSQTSLRLALGISTRFTERGRWGEGMMFKAGIACLLSDPVDLNERRRGCAAGDLDNWFIKASMGRSFDLPGTVVRAYVRAEGWWEMPDHDFATTVIEAPRVSNSYDDDGQHLLIINAMQYLMIPVVRREGVSRLEVRVGGGAGLFRQQAQRTEAQPDPSLRVSTSISTAIGDALLSWNPTPAFSASGGVRVSSPHRRPETTPLSPYLTGQFYMELRP